jgi:hypothetical protein
MPSSTTTAVVWQPAPLTKPSRSSILKAKHTAYPRRSRGTTVQYGPSPGPIPNMAPCLPAPPSPARSSSTAKSRRETGSRFTHPPRTPPPSTWSLGHHMRQVVCLPRRAVTVACHCWSLLARGRRRRRSSLDSMRSRRLSPWRISRLML